MESGKKGRSRVRAVCGDAAAVAVCVRGQGRERGMKHSRNSQQIQGDFQDFEAPAPAEPEYAGEVTMALPPVPMPDPNARRGLAQPAAKLRAVRGMADVVDRRPVRAHAGRDPPVGVMVRSGRRRQLEGRQGAKRRRAGPADERKRWRAHRAGVRAPVRPGVGA